MQQAGRPGASTFCGGGGWLTVAEAAVDGEVARIAVEPTLEHALVSTTACSLWCAASYCIQHTSSRSTPPSCLFHRVCDMPAGISIFGRAACTPEVEYKLNSLLSLS